MVSKWIVLVQGLIFRFHVKLPVCSSTFYFRFGRNISPISKSIKCRSGRMFPQNSIPWTTMLSSYFSIILCTIYININYILCISIFPITTSTILQQTFLQTQRPFFNAISSLQNGKKKQPIPNLHLLKQKQREVPKGLQTYQGLPSGKRWHTVDASEIPFPTTVFWCFLKPCK